MAKSKKRRLGKKSKLSGILYSSNDELKVRKKFFNDLSGKEIYNSFPKIHNHRFFKVVTDSDRLRDLSQFYIPVIPESNVIKSAYILLAIVKSHQEDIQKFITYEKLVTKEILNGNYEDALSILNTCDDQIGISCWSLSLRGSLVSLLGDHNQKVELDKFIDINGKTNDFIISISKSISSRFIDPEIFLSNINAFTNQIIRSFDGTLLHFLLYKLTLKDYSYKYNYNYILNVEKNGSLIDIFKAIISFCEDYFNAPDEEFESRKDIIKKLSKMFEYPSIQGIADLMGVPSDWSFNYQEYEMLDLYTIGNYEGMKDLFEKDPQIYYEFQYYELIAKAVTRINKIKVNGLAQDIIQSLVSVLKKDGNYLQSLSYLLCLCHSFYSLRWFSEMHTFLYNEYQTLDMDKKKYLRELSIVKSGFNSPRKLEILDIDNGQHFAKRLREDIGESTTYYLCKNKDTIFENPKLLNSGIESKRLEKYICKSLIDSKNFSKAIPRLEKLRGSEDILISHEVSALLVESYIETGQDTKAIEEFVVSCINNCYLINNYETEKICEVSKRIANSSDSIYIPIALSLSSRYVNSKFDPVLRFSFETFLKNNNVKTPLENVDIYSSYPEYVSNYFLEHVCIPDVMKLYLYFNSTREIENCRIDICNFLIGKNVSKDKIIHELKERTKKQVISNAYKCVENSRIYSDTTQFYSGSGSKRFIQLYNKFKELRDKDYSEFEDEKSLNNVYELFKSQDMLSSAYTTYVLKMPLNEKNQTFMNLLQRMRDEFCFGERGLNNFLSTRIRHGHLPTMLRKCVSDENLVTSKVSDESSYKSNEFWMNRLRYLDDKSYKKIDKLLIEFSSNFQLQIDTINDKWLQIFTLDQSILNLADNKSISEAIFTYSISNFESYVVQQRIPQDADYDGFATYVIDWLWSRTDINLEKAKDMISNKARQSFFDLLRDLQRSLLEIVADESKISEINNAIGRARASLTSNLEQILTWFARSEESIVAQYEIEIAVEIAKRSAGVDINIEKDKSYYLKGKTLSHFVDLFFILLENATTKSGLSRDQLELNFQILESKEDVKFVIRNKCKPIEDLNAANNNLEFYRKLYGRRDVPISNIQGEGGTGFFKIWNIIGKTLELNHEIDFGFVKNNIFEVIVTFHDFFKVEDHENSSN